MSLTRGDTGEVAQKAASEGFHLSDADLAEYRKLCAVTLGHSQ